MSGFPEALTWLRNGQRIRRAGWQPNTHVALLPGAPGSAGRGDDVNDDGDGDAVFSAVQHFALCTHHWPPTLRPWLPTAEDLLAGDWSRIRQQSPAAGETA